MYVARGYDVFYSPDVYQFLYFFLFLRLTFFNWFSLKILCTIYSAYYFFVTLSILCYFQQAFILLYTGIPCSLNHFICLQRKLLITSIKVVWFIVFNRGEHSVVLLVSFNISLHYKICCNHNCRLPLGNTNSLPIRETGSRLKEDTNFL